MGRNDSDRERAVSGGLGAPAQPREGEVRLRTGAALACLVCGGRDFAHREIKLNTTGMTFMDLDWPTAPATARSAGPAGSSTPSSTAV